MPGAPEAMNTSDQAKGHAKGDEKGPGPLFHALRSHPKYRPNDTVKKQDSLRQAPCSLRALRQWQIRNSDKGMSVP